MQVAGKIIVVTGAASGLGRALAAALTARGAKVAGVDVNAAAQFVVDIGDKAAVAALPAQVEAQLGAVDGLINCAGIIQPFVRLADLDDAAIDRVLRVNLFGTLHMTRAFLPRLLQRPAAHIVNISSMGGFLPVPGQTIYGASKAAVKLMTEGLHSELQGTPVRVTLVLPGGMSTNIVENSGVKMSLDGKKMKKVPPMVGADDAARIVVDAMERDAYRVLVGKDARMLDVLYRLSPRRAAGFIARQMQGLLS